jgi:pSer/pThr/pTyr-binding forkhead associated (FHA) protein
VAEVVIEQAGVEKLRLPLKRPVMVLGRDPTCDVHLDHKTVSRKHIALETRGAAIWVRDLGGRNGTKINNVVVSEPTLLNGGDRIEVGHYIVRMEGVDEARANTPILTLTGPHGPHRFAMIDSELVIGRAPSCDITIDDKNVSRRHLKVTLQGDSFVAEDLGSQNGTLINGKRVNGPTPFRSADKIGLSGFTLEFGFEQPAAPTNGEKPTGRTMMLDRSQLAKAAYIGGDADALQDAANLAIGPRSDVQQSPLAGDDDEEEESTRGALAEELPAVPARPVAPAKRPGMAAAATPAPPVSTPAPTMGRPPPKAAPSRPAPPPRLSVNHPDFGPSELSLEEPVVVLGEDGTEGDGTDGRQFSNHGYIAFIKTAQGVTACVVGDRRLLLVNGKPLLSAALNDGDTVELGALSVVFQRVN